jgi:hypothetical protein
LQEALQLSLDIAKHWRVVIPSELQRQCKACRCLIVRVWIRKRCDDTHCWLLGAIEPYVVVCCLCNQQLHVFVAQRWYGRVRICAHPVQYQPKELWVSIDEDRSIGISDARLGAVQHARKARPWQCLQSRTNRVELGASNIERNNRIAFELRQSQSALLLKQLGCSCQGLFSLLELARCTLHISEDLGEL